MKKTSRRSQARMENLVESLLREEIALHGPRAQFRKKLLRRLQKERQPKNGGKAGIVAGLAAVIWWCKAPSVMASVALMVTGAATVYLSPYLPGGTIQDSAERLAFVPDVQENPTVALHADPQRPVRAKREQSSARSMRTLALVEQPIPVRTMRGTIADSSPVTIPSVEQNTRANRPERRVATPIAEETASSATSNARLEEAPMAGLEVPVENPPVAASSEPTTHVSTAADSIPQPATESSASTQSSLSSASEEPSVIAAELSPSSLSTVQLSPAEEAVTLGTVPSAVERDIVLTVKEMTAFTENSEGSIAVEIENVSTHVWERLTVELQWNGMPQEQVLENLQPGEKRLLTVRYTFSAAGRRTFTLIADPKNAVQETKEDNNRLEQAIDVLPVQEVPQEEPVEPQPEDAAALPPENTPDPQ